MKIWTTGHDLPDSFACPGPPRAWISGSRTQGTIYGVGIATHRLTIYKAASGALVFSAGTIQWSWGLDGTA